MKREDVFKFNRKLNNINLNSPLSIGNGDFVMTLDITSTQTLHNLYKDIPLSTISNKLWFTKDIKEDLPHTDINGKKYMLNDNGNPKLYELKRRYPHKFNLYFVKILYKGNVLDQNEIKNINQTLDLYNGVSTSVFTYMGEDVSVTSVIYQDSDTFHFEFNASSNFSILLEFTYPSYNKIGYIYDKNVNLSLDNCELLVTYDEENNAKLYINSNQNYKISNNHIIFDNQSKLILDIGLEKVKNKELLSNFWNEDTGILLEDDKLSERMILSKYLLKLNSTGIYPPSEAGLTYNNWNSKFHLEMHLIHSLWLIYDNHLDLLLKSFDYYMSIITKAKKRALLNNYKGIRLPKMTSPDGLDSPSPIGPLLIWQVPHIVYFLQEIYRIYKREDIIKKYEPLISGSVDFMISFINKKDGIYNITDPMLTCCESIPFEKCINPIFEIEYFRHVFKNQSVLDNVLYGKDRYNYNDLYINLALPKLSNDIYLKTHSMNDEYDIYPDHPVELFSYSFFKSDFIDPKCMEKTLKFVLENLDLSSYWGWDFPLMGMCALNLGYKSWGYDIAMMDSFNNSYLYNGHNTSSRDDLKIYLPGNGAFLLFYRLLSKGDKAWEK